ncbi:lantibiotic immunity ABC transporter MutE/EpiE family permease subunit [Clostridioides difficile]|uniref:lantibiotic immunity ABC transporter MutE/EpiE family permease subunit n=1 Tax=Clostridioides difficile TaxID=1496 RepID=UPI001C15FCF2|nr:lantibiotic immunity ABC transporter MutE/EpiE family permease subunit [Clostridioides difficile]MDU3241511.1 lantibiotic immunity ABC transporter MutE/EpiE family permease subunit [Clostridiales bacterium]MDL0186108.1 lantibiotic immunity ABC transporter MutE/EpiE family permease subunit [Clostridioides difficile]MDL0189095.1 lantibiotic immunity ABC transporter MutE/EpiE family permease subunit [Clostridioides difficile]HBF2210813.1 lantibiotic immunity ABC transporter MutE/EpiE family per
MLNYIVSENLKQKNTFAKKLIWLAPIITILLNIFAPIWYQQNSYNWWYILLHTGLVTLLCILVMQRDSGKLKFRAIFPLPVNLESVWQGKILLCSFYMILSNVLFMVFNLIGGYVIYFIYDIPMKVSIMQAITGTFCIIVASLWNIPLCFWLIKKIGIFCSLIFNVGLSFILGALLSNMGIWMLCPYSWVPRLMIPTLNILPNGEPALTSELSVPIILIIVILIIAVLLFLLLTKITAYLFSRQEAK